LTKYIYIFLTAVLFLTGIVSAVVPTTYNTTPMFNTTTLCLNMSGSSTVTESVWFDYGHTLNPGFSSSTPNHTVTAGVMFREVRCNEPTFLPGNTYKFRACGAISGCGATKLAIMPVLVPHALETLSIYGEEFMAQGDNPLGMAQSVWAVYGLVWGSYFMMILIGFIFMNITIKQRSIAMSFLLMLISGSAIFTLTSKTPEMTQIAVILMAIALAGLVFWMYKRKR